MKRGRLSVWLWCGILLLCKGSLFGAEITNLACVADTCLYEANPDHNLGSMTALRIGRTSTGPRARALFKFDVAGSIPSHARIVSASFNWQVIEHGGEDVSFGAHRVLRAWGEGNKAGDDGDILGAPAEDGEATWNARLFPTALWAEAGGAASLDYVALPSASVMVDGDAEEYSFSSSGVTSDVQLWLTNPGSNYGWLVKVEDELQTGTELSCGAREATDGAPTLTVEYTATPRPRLQNARVSGNQFHFQFLAEASYSYVVEHKDALTGSGWTPLTVVPSDVVTRTIVVTDTMTGGNRFYRIEVP